MAKGIRVSPSNKRNLRAEIYSRDDFMVLHEFGGIKKPRGRSLALPRGARRTKRGIISKGQRPRAVLQRPRTFIAPVAQGGQGIFERRGRKRYPIRFLYHLHRGGARIQSRFGFRDTVAKAVRSRWEKNFGQALARALATAKR